MRFLLDSNAVIALMRRHETFIGRLELHRPRDLGIPSIVTHELFFGAHRGARVAENLDRVEALQFEIVAFDLEDARCAGAIRARLSKAGTPIGPLDALIAGQAVARGLILVTHNTREFQRVPELTCEDWE